MVVKISKLSGISESRGHHFYAKKLNQNSIVVDLGAHLGEFSTELSKSFGCKCFAVEALPSLYKKIKESKLLSKFNYAIIDSEKKVSFSVCENLESNHVSNSSNGSESDNETIDVDGISLFRFMKNENINNISLLKVDIEGAEVALFNSTSDEILKNIDQISIEFHDFKLDIKSDVERIIKRLKYLGFICVRYSFYTNGDILFFNARKLNMNFMELLYIRFLSRYFRGLPRAMRKIIR